MMSKLDDVQAACGIHNEAVQLERERCQMIARIVRDTAEPDDNGQDVADRIDYLIGTGRTAAEIDQDLQS